MSRHRKPTALLKLQGTYRADRHENRADNLVNEVIPALTNVPIPVEIKDEFVKHYFAEHITFLEKLHLLQEPDIPHLTQMYLILQQLREVNTKLEEVQKKGIIENLDTYETLIKLMTKLTEKYNSIAATYYITPLARTKLTIDSLNIKKLESENPSITAKMLNKKRA